MTELSAEFEKYLTEAYSARPSKVLCSLLQPAFLAGAAVGAKRERERCVEIVQTCIANYTGYSNMMMELHEYIEENIRREGEGENNTL